MNHKHQNFAIEFTKVDEQNLPLAVNYLVEIDTDFSAVVRQFGAPPLWKRDEGFSTLLYIILEQQVSLASARATFEKLKQAVYPLDPENFLKADDALLKKAGFSRQKTNYGRNLANAVIKEELSFSELAASDDETVRHKLTRIKGIGTWTANIYLLMALQRPDVIPFGDLALVIALQKLKKLPKRPDNDTLHFYFEKWRPWRSVAARILWHFYLNGGSLNLIRR